MTENQKLLKGVRLMFRAMIFLALFMATGFIGIRDTDFSQIHNYFGLALPVVGTPLFSFFAYHLYADIKEIKRQIVLDELLPELKELT